MFQQLLSIARNTFTESIRQPIFTVLVLVGALGMWLNQQLAAYSMEVGGGDNKMMLDMGLGTIALVGLLLAAFTATGVVNNEIENRTVLTVVSKPVSRPVFVVGKYLGVAAAIAVAFYTLSLIFLLVVRHRVLSTASDRIDWPVVLFGVGAALVALGVATAGNYLLRWVFTSTFAVTLAVAETVAFLLVLVVSKDWQLQSPLTELMVRDGEMFQVIIGLVLVFEAVLILTAVAVAASTRLGQVMTLLTCVGVFMVGLVSNSLSQWTNDRLELPPYVGLAESVRAVFTADVSFFSKLVFLLAKGVYVVVPNLQFLWPADAITQGHSLVHNADGQFTLVYVGQVTGYTALYVGIVLAVAVTLFQTREVG